MGRLLHFLRDGKLVLSNLRYLVLDEADELLTENFFEDVLEVKGQKDIDPDHRTLLFSATFSSEARMRLEQVVKKDFIFVQIGQINSAVDTVKQDFVEVTKYKKYELLLDLLHAVATDKEREDASTWRSVEKTMVFVEHKRQSDLLSIKLAQAGFSDRTLKQRYDARLKFIHGVYEILVCTDLGAKGHNFPGVEHVINYDMPEQDRLVYIHRIGRAGRIGNIGRATSFFDPESEFDRRHAKFYVQTLKQSMQSIPSFLQEIAEFQDSHPYVPAQSSRRRWRNH
uniref:RNA helicase n=1 Tax=Ditylenchus dipsaci TaxID=166011 RepID=A0A915DD93_9BILA